MASVTTESGITVHFNAPEDLTWGEAKEIARRMTSPTPEDVEYALAVMITGWEGDLVKGKAVPKVVETDGVITIASNGLNSLKMRTVNEIAEVIMAAATAEGKETTSGTPST